MLFSKLETSSIEVLLGKFAVKELIEFERFCRDNALWEQMKECYAKESKVTISWYKGDGYGFVEASRKMKIVAPHKLNNTLVWLNGNRAVAVCMACIQTRKEIEGIAMDLSSYVRLVYTVFKDEDIWKIASLDAIYEKDNLVPFSPASVHPSHTHRPSYALLTSMIESENHTIDQELPGDDCPELREALLSKVEEWLIDA